MSSKLREALEFIKLASDDYEEYGKTMGGALDVIYEKACSALAEPRRNCDVGTAEEQDERFDAYCVSHTNCAHCPLKGTQCLLVWSQMPYETVKTNKTKTNNKGE